MELPLLMRKLLRLALVCQMLLALPSLHYAQSTEEPQENAGHWRFAHFGSRDLSLDVYVQKQLSSIQGVPYGEVSEWQTTAPGVYEFSAHTAGDTANPHFTLPDISIDSDEWLTVVAVGTDDQINGYVINEDYSPLPNNESRLTVFYAIEDVPDVDVRMNGVPVLQTSRIEDSQSEIEAPSVDLASDTYNLDIIATGASQNIVLDATQVELLPNRNYLAAAVNTSEDPRFVLVSTELQSNNDEAVGDHALVRVAHLSSGSPGMDITFDGEIVEALSQLFFPEFTSWVEVDAGTAEVSLQLSSDGTPASTPADVEFPAGSFTTLVIIGSPQNETLQIQPVREDYEPVPPNSVRINVFNAYPGIGALDFRNTDGETYIDALGYPGFFGGNNGFNTFTLEAGTYDLQIALDDSGEGLVDLSGASFYSGRSYFIAAIDADPPYVLTFSDVQETQNLLQAETTAAP
jgi:hypothetical protein